MSEINDSNRAITEADIVQAAPYNLDGSGVTVLVYDGGYARAGHVDFQGRLTVGDTSGLSDHATHVSGTIGGAGVANPAYKGMAPNVTIESYGFEVEGGLQAGFLYTDPGDLEADYAEAINTYGADISNNSIGSNVESNGFDCAWQGDYGVTSALIDAIVGGSLGAPFRIVWANGNERQGSRCDVEGYGDYYSTAPPAGAKNHITVGALNSNDDSMTYFSSWGPVDDGRMKPDVSAPGCQSGGDGGVTSTSSAGDTAYTTKCGRSLASPTVCGLSALLLQDFRVQFPNRPDPRNSTLKILLAHNAVDLGNIGPDYQYGYGSVRIRQTIDFMRTGNFLEDQVDQDGIFSVLVVVDPGAPELKVTLAWDDVPGTPNVDPALVNDLDLRVFDPDSQQHYPWTLDPLNPSAPAVQTQANHVDNIEQVFVNSPAAGVWRIEVYGLSVPQGPQSFSLCAFPTLIACSSQGTIALDSAKYACSATAEIQVIDCDLNTDNGLVETVTVKISSTSEPGGESMLLTETGAETADFRGSIALSTTNDAGVLQVANGDTVTATYTDADDGQGGTNLPVTTTAFVDCTPPEISNVQTTDIEPFRATVTFGTDEPADGTVRYGLSCSSPWETMTGGGYETSHLIKLTDLTENTTYYYAVDAGDEAGNTSTNDNGGACYTFTTPDIPDYFTEHFDSADNDLDNLSLRFNPDGSYDFYSGCAEPIAALPVDPGGGTPLSLSDDSSALVTLSGGETVSLYGTSYGSFHVGSNGYITFTLGDSDYSETVADHFDLPRISALFDDFNPASGGTVSWKQLADRAVVTWEDIPQYGTSDYNTFQVEMRFDGTIVISYLDIDAPDGLAGLSEGSGVAADFYESDLSAMESCGEPTCSDGIQNQGEDRIDCGGPCDSCECLSDIECNYIDGLYCNGMESCDAYGDCQPGTLVDCDDGVGCTEDSCNEGTGSCDNIPEDTLCDDGLFCNGAETCDPIEDCQTGADPCPGQDCDELNNVCVPLACNPNGTCEEDEDCISCPDDCIGKLVGKPSARYCCGDGVCEGSEDVFNCAIDCGSPPECGDTNCDPGEDWCNCLADCPDTPPPPESDCFDGIDNDCDGSIDEDDPDCVCLQRDEPCLLDSECCSNRCHRGKCK
ncbi:MAG: S8 family serine peptidase [Planctomycetota bacterium]|nr:MAG: S8 family serine peptidase [Planctomycetota bacterium]